jgi:hypothetical protein
VFPAARSVVVSVSVNEYDAAAEISLMKALSLLIGFCLFGIGRRGPPS